MPKANKASKVKGKTSDLGTTDEKSGFDWDSALGGGEDSTSEAKSKAKSGGTSSVMLKAVTCIKNGANGMVMPNELFKVEGSKGNDKKGIKPTTARQEADRLIKLGVAVGAK